MWGTPITKYCWAPMLAEKENISFQAVQNNQKNLLETDNVNLYHEQEFIKKLFRVISQSLEIFKVYGGLKFRFEILNIFNDIS